MIALALAALMLAAAPPQPQPQQTPPTKPKGDAQQGATTAKPGAAATPRPGAPGTAPAPGTGAAPGTPAARGTPAPAPGGAPGTAPPSGTAGAPATAPPYADESATPARIPIESAAPQNPAIGRQCFAPNSITTHDYEAARVAWRYFERNFQPATGFVNAVENYPSTTMWDLGSSLIGTIAARELELIDQKTFDDRVAPLLRTLGRLKLFNDEMPNKAYNSKTAEMTDYANKPSAVGIGYSAIDIARIVSALHLLTCLHPKHAPAVERTLLRWRWCRIVQQDGLYGVHAQANQPPKVGQEGRLGYEQYAAKGLQMLGFNLGPLASYTNKNSSETVIYGVPIRYDNRDPKKFGALNYVVTESYALDAMEFGRGGEMGDLVKRIYEVQRRRWQETGKVTAVSEDHVDEPPHFVYNTIYVSGEPWKATTDKGEDVARLKSVSTKAAFMLAALYPEEPYSQVVLDAVSSAYDPDRGWYSGVYDAGGYNRSVTSNTNGIVLESVLFKLYGALHPRCAACNRKMTYNPGILSPDQQSVSCFPGVPLRSGSSVPGGAPGGVGPGAAPPAGPGPARSGPGLPPPAPAAPAPSQAPVTRPPERSEAPRPMSDPFADAQVTPPASPSRRATQEPPELAIEGPRSERRGREWVEGPLAGIAPPQSGVVAPLPQRGLRSRYGIGGNVFGTYRPNGSATFGGTARVSRGPLFVRAGSSWRIADATVDAGQPRFGWLWGLGYDDWRPRTWSVQLNNWGPVRPGEGIAWRRSTFDVGYKLPPFCVRRPFCVGSVAAMTVPVAGNPSVGVRANFTIGGSWFLMAGTSVAVPEVFPPDEPQRRFRLVYGIGRLDWRAGTPFLTFYNWGPQTGLDEGVATAGINWAF